MHPLRYAARGMKGHETSMTTQSTSTQARNWRDLIRPKALIEEDRDAHTDFYGKFVCEPLERGFGITIGNSLRRVLLSSLQGAAITAVRRGGPKPASRTAGSRSG